MGRAPRVGGWRAARLASVHQETPTAQTLTLAVPGWEGHLAGQHVDLRLTAPDGYTAERSYSIASAPDGELVQVTVQEIVGGEVSPYLVGGFEVGDEIEVRGPLGGWFVWDPDDTAPVLLVGGGSGVVPLMAMVRARRKAGSVVPFRLLYSVREPQDRLYAAELRRPQPGDGGLDVAMTYTRSAPEGYPRPVGRLTSADLQRDGWPADFGPSCFVCGPTPFVESIAGMLVALGHDARQVKTERFGSTGGTP